MPAVIFKSQRFLPAVVGAVNFVAVIGLESFAAGRASFFDGFIPAQFFLLIGEVVLALIGAIDARIRFSEESFAADGANFFDRRLPFATSLFTGSLPALIGAKDALRVCRRKLFTAV